MPNGYTDKASLSVLLSAERRENKKKKEKERGRGRSAKFDPPRSLPLLWPLFFRICSTRGRAHLRLVACCSCEKRDSEGRVDSDRDQRNLLRRIASTRFPRRCAAAVAADRRVTEIVSREQVSTCTFEDIPVTTLRRKLRGISERRRGRVSEGSLWQRCIRCLMRGNQQWGVCTNSRETYSVMCMCCPRVYMHTRQRCMQ